MKKVLVFLLILTGTVPGIAQPRFNGFLQNWTAYNLNDDHVVFLLRNRFRLNTTLSGDWARGYASIDFSDEVQGEKPEQDFSVRQLYFDLYFDRFDLRVGKQQVIWGKADGVFINDIVNPLDLRYFLMQDFDDIRQGSMMIKANAYLGSWGLEALFIPKFEPWQMAEPGSPWEFYRPDTMLVWLSPSPLSSSSSLVPLPIAFNWQEQSLPEVTLKNGEIGLKLSGLLLGTDISLLYLNSFQDSPVAQIDTMEIQVDMTGGYPVPERGELYLAPNFERNVMYGLNFSRPFGGLVLRGELGYFTDYHFNLQPEFSPELMNLLMSGSTPEISNIITSDFLQVMVGTDITGPWSISLSMQYIRKQVLDYDPMILSNQEIEEMLTLMLSGTFWNEEGNAKCLTLYDKTNESGLSRVMMGYKITDAVLFETGVDILWGKQESFIGQFANNDNIYLKLIYSF